LNDLDSGKDLLAGARSRDATLINIICFSGFLVIFANLGSLYLHLLRAYPVAKALSPCLFQGAGVGLGLSPPAARPSQATALAALFIEAGFAWHYCRDGSRLVSFLFWQHGRN